MDEHEEWKRALATQPKSDEPELRRFVLKGTLVFEANDIEDAMSELAMIFMSRMTYRHVKEMELLPGTDFIIEPENANASLDDLIVSYEEHLPPDTSDIPEADESWFEKAKLK